MRTKELDNMNRILYYDNKMQLPRLKCKRCGYTWVPRIETKPKTCPNCKNPNWDEERSEREMKVKQR